MRIIVTLLILFAAATMQSANAQDMVFATSNANFQITNVKSNVDTFNFNVRINVPMAPGAYINPDIVSVTYQVMGELDAGTPSGFPAFDLRRTITGQEFYAQGSSLSFEIASSAVLTDGIQVAELVGANIVFTFNGREVDTGRFHPALFELHADGTGRLQNSDNVPSLNPRNEIAFGEEYITDLTFDPGNATLITSTQIILPNGGGSATPLDVFVLFLLLVFACARHRRRIAQWVVPGQTR